jgi:SAM-dependent methyltransferase
MDYSFIAPPVPSFSRWIAMRRRDPKQSVLRMLQNEFILTLPITGKVLDMGGGRKAKYLPLLPLGLDITSVNIDAEFAPTHLVKPGQPLPFQDNSFDTVICFNTLEHIYDATAVLAELHRVVKPGGLVHVTVPFMFRIHGHPDDYFRATPSWWRETFSRIGFAALEFHPLVWGRASTSSVVPGFRGIAPRTKLQIAMLKDILSASFTFNQDRMYGPRGERIAGTSPGWFMTGMK